MKTIEEDDIDVICIQEAYVINNKVVGIPKKYKILAHGEGRHRAAIVITNKMIDSILIRQLSDEDAVVTEVVYNKVKCNGTLPRERVATIVWVKLTLLESI